MKERKYNFNPTHNFKGVGFVRPWYHVDKKSGLCEQHSINGVVFRYGSDFNSPVVAIALPHKDWGVMLYFSPLCAELGGMQTRGDVYRYATENWEYTPFPSIFEVRSFLRIAFKKGGNEND